MIRVDFPAPVGPTIAIFWPGNTWTEKSFIISKQEIVDNDYVFSFNKYQKKEIVKKTYRPTNEIVSSIKDLEKQFSEIMKEIEKGL